jgi:hypothetical protein
VFRKDAHGEIMVTGVKEYPVSDLRLGCTTNTVTKKNGI